MTNVAGHFYSHIGTVSQVVPAAMSYENQAFRESKTDLNSGFRIPGTEFRILLLWNLDSLICILDIKD